MQQIQDGLYVGDDTDCREGNEDWSIVHACKRLCHKSGASYSDSLSPPILSNSRMKTGGPVYEHN